MNKIFQIMKLFAIWVLISTAFSCKMKSENESESESEKILMEGIFKVPFLKSNGTIQLDDNRIVIQFGNIRDAQVINVDFSIDSIGKIIPTTWICALTKDYKMVRCSTGKNIFNTQRLFDDNGYYTVQFDFNDEIKASDVRSIKVSIMTDNRNDTIVTNVESILHVSQSKFKGL